MDIVAWVRQAVREAEAAFPEWLREQIKKASEEDGQGTQD